MSTLLEHALAYAAQGWPVFPLRSRDKVPAIPSAHPKGDPLRGVCTGECGREGHGLYDATTDADRIRAWWIGRPTANIGLRTGVAFDVLDLDHADPEEATAEWPAMTLLGGPVARTGKGWHFYVKPTGQGNRTALNGPCDWRGAGGYVVAPPSIHPSGHAYEWFAPHTVPLHEIPTELRELLEGNLPADLPQGPERIPVAAAPMMRGKWNPAGVFGQLVIAAQGTRNSTLLWCANRLGMDLHDGKATASEVLAALDRLAEVARSIGLTDHEIDGTIRSGFTKGKAGLSNRGAA